MIKYFKKIVHQLFPKLSKKIVARKKNKKFYTFYKKIIPKQSLCFDIGANIGKRTAIFLDLGAEVVAVEPQNSCLKTLKSKFGNNQSVHIVPKAVGQVVGTATMQLCNLDEVSSLSEEFVKYCDTQGNGLKFEEKATVMMTTLDILIKDFGLPYFCKIDVENFEKQALMGLSQALPMLSFEFTAPFKQNTIACIELLERLTVYEYNYTVFEEMKFVLTAWVSASDMINILQTMPASVLVGDVYGRVRGKTRLPY